MTRTEPRAPAAAPDRNQFLRAWQHTFTSLRTRNFRLFFFGQLVSNTGNWLTNIAITLLVLHLTNSGLAVGAITAAQYGPILLFSVWAGAIADRSDKRRLLSCGDPRPPRGRSATYGWRSATSRRCRASASRS